MRVSSIVWQPENGWTKDNIGNSAGLVLYFGTRELIADGAAFDALKQQFPSAQIVGCSTGGQMDGENVVDDKVCATVFSFDSTRIKVFSEPAQGADRSRECGEVLGKAAKADDLAAIFVLSDGLNINGSALVAGLMGQLGNDIPITGGLAGDGANFMQTLVGCNDRPVEGQVAVVGFYGKDIQIGHGSAGGWDAFGPRRKITRSHGNVLFELDGQPALDLYERYLGKEDAKRLPGSALLFPIMVFDPAAPDHDIVRTVLSVDHETRSMTFAGDVPEGWSAQLMRGHFLRLIDGAANASRQASSSKALSTVNDNENESAAILVSCIGRRLLLGQRIDEEVEAAISELPKGTLPMGFYSYGELSPHAVSGICEMHNQTMTVTTIREATG